MRTAKKDTQGKPGRPRKELTTEDILQIHQLAAIQCTEEEICAVIGISPDTLARRKADPIVRQALEGGKAKGRVSLRRLQWKAANAGNPALLIFLGKNLLGQRDKPEEAGIEDTLDKARQIRDALRTMTDIELGDGID